MAELNEIAARAPFTVIAAAIHKEKLRTAYHQPWNPYHAGLLFCLERLKYYLEDEKATACRVHVVFESRGRREDAALELEFRRIGSLRQLEGPFEFEPVFASKGSNSTGLQMADLIARPIGRHVLSPGQSNRAYEIIEPKFRRSSAGVIQGYGLKCFP